MKTNISINAFDASSVDNAIDELRAYELRIQMKAAELGERIATIVAREASMVFNTATADTTIRGGPVTGQVEVTVTPHGNYTVIVADGRDAVFMEFGAGVYFNGPAGSSPNPLGAENGFTIGSYGNGQGAKETWAFYDMAGNKQISHGTPASMPLYNAITAAANDIAQIAREVFST